METTSLVKFSPELLALFAGDGDNSVAPFTKEIFLEDILASAVASEVVALVASEEVAHRYIVALICA